MINDDLTKLNREVAEWLLKKHHHYNPNADGTDGKKPHLHYPNYILYPVDLLRELMKREDWRDDWGLREAMFSTDDDGNACMPEQRMAELVTDQTGLLLRKVGEWPGFKERGEKR